MLTVFIVIHLLIAVSMIALILLQKTEGNAAGGGFSVSSMSAMQPRARANPLSTATAILGLTFFVSSVSLALLAKHLGPAPSVLDEPAAAAAGSTRAPRVDEINNAPAVPPAADAPAAATPAAPADTTPGAMTGAPPAATPAAPAAPPAVPKN